MGYLQRISKQTRDEFENKSVSALNYLAKLIFSNHQDFVPDVAYQIASELITALIFPGEHMVLL